MVNLVRKERALTFLPLSRETSREIQNRLFHQCEMKIFNNHCVLIRLHRLSNVFLTQLTFELFFYQFLGHLTVVTGLIYVLSACFLLSVPLRSFLTIDPHIILF